MSLLDTAKSLPDELMNITIGTIGGIVGWLVSDNKSVGSLVACFLVGGFAAYTFVPFILWGLSTIGVLVPQNIIPSLYGSIGALSWQLIIVLKSIPKKILDSVVSKFDKGVEK